MNKVILTAAIVAAAFFSVMEANHIASTNVSNLKFDDIEAVAQNNPEYIDKFDTPSNGEKAPYYERYKVNEWYGYATGSDHHLHQAHFIDWGCKPGWILDSCSPYTEVIIYE